MNKYEMIDGMIRLVDRIFDQRGAERAESLGVLIKQLAELGAMLQEEDKKAGMTNVPGSAP